MRYIEWCNQQNINGDNNDIPSDIESEIRADADGLCDFEEEYLGIWTGEEIQGRSRK